MHRKWLNHRSVCNSFPPPLDIIKSITNILYIRSFKLMCVLMCTTCGRSSTAQNINMKDALPRGAELFRVELTQLERENNKMFTLKLKEVFTINNCVTWCSTCRVHAFISFNMEMCMRVNTLTQESKQTHSWHMLSYFLRVTLSRPFTLSLQVKQSADGST